MLSPFARAGIFGLPARQSGGEKTKESGLKIMKATGIVRKVDELGRVVLPVEMRRTMNIDEQDSMEIYVEGNTVMLKKYEPDCIFCGETKNVTQFRGKNVCRKCLKELKK